jgi:hypothetical protein
VHTYGLGSAQIFVISPRVKIQLPSSEEISCSWKGSHVSFYALSVCCPFMADGVLSTVSEVKYNNKVNLTYDSKQL